MIFNPTGEVEKNTYRQTDFGDENKRLDSKTDRQIGTFR
jgi:hypothetical protein